MKKQLLALSLSAIATMSMAQTPAFPGAEGHGRYVTGGRGGKIVHVTNLNDSGTGSFREAVKGSAKKIVVFDVAGVIPLNSDLTIGANTTIDRQHPIPASHCATALCAVPTTSSCASYAADADRNATLTTAPMPSGTDRRQASSSTTVRSAGASTRWHRSTTTTTSRVSRATSPRASATPATAREPTATEASGAESSRRSTTTS